METVIFFRFHGKPVHGKKFIKFHETIPWKKKKTLWNSMKNKPPWNSSKFLEIKNPPSMEVHVPKFSMELHGKFSREFHGTPWNSMELHGTPWNSMELHGTPWNSMELHGTPWNSMELHGIPWNSMSQTQTDFHGIPWNSMGYFTWGTSPYGQPVNTATLLLIVYFILA